MENKKLSVRLWLLIWVIGIAGQICWNMENQWFNTFVYAKIGKDPSIITGMLIASAAATTFSTFFFGTWSDRTGRRRIFVGLGYILWGIFTIAFGLTEFISKEYYTMLSVMVVLADTIMSFFGSMGNDAGFNVWINDHLTQENSGKIGAALATQPVIGTLLGTVLGGLLIGSNDDYLRLFTVMGVAVILCGVWALVALRHEDNAVPSRRGTFWQQFASVFNFREFFSHKELLWVNITVTVFFIGFNMYFAYMGNYLIYYLGYTADKMGIIEAVPLVLAMLISLPVSKAISRNLHDKVLPAAILMNIAGLLLMSFVRPGDVNTDSYFSLPVFLGVLLVGIGYIAFLQIMKIWAKQLYPENARGQFEGIWIIFFVLLPMIGGSLLGQAVVQTSGETFVDEASGLTQYIPNQNIYVFGALVIALSLIPAFFAIRAFRRRMKESQS